MKITVAGLVYLLLQLDDRDTLQPQFLRGDHGHDPKHLSMHSIFYASGPALKKGILVDRFESVHIYNLLASLLNIKAAPNDGNPSIIEPLLVH